MGRSLLLLATAVSLAFAPAPVYRPRKAEVVPSRVVAMMEGFRSEMPPAEGENEENGKGVAEFQPFLPSHLQGVARRMRAMGRAECRALMPYLVDRDPKLRFIAGHAINGATRSYPDGMSLRWQLDLGSAGHSEMARRFAERIETLDP